MLFLHRKLRTCLDLLKPSVAAVVDEAQGAQCTYRVACSKARTFSVGDPVLVRDYRKGEEKWTAGTVTSQAGRASYQVSVGPTHRWNRHTDQMMACHANIVQATADVQPTPSMDSLPALPDTGRKPETSSSVSECVTTSGQSDIAHTDTPVTHQQTLNRYPRRDRRPPERLTICQSLWWCHLKQISSKGQNNPLTHSRQWGSLPPSLS